MTAALRKDAPNSADQIAPARSTTPEPERQATTQPKKTQSGLEVLLSIEDRIRAAKNETEMQHLIVNETRKIVGARQIFLLCSAATGRFRTTAVSSLALVDKDTPLVRWTEKMVANLAREHGLDEHTAFQLPAFVDPEANETTAYPFANLLWVPFKLGNGDVFAGMLLARERPWTEQEENILARQARVYANAWCALYGGAKLKPNTPFHKWLIRLCVVGLICSMAFPVSMTTLAPVEIVADKPDLVTAPLDGVIHEILVDPNQPVKAGQELLRFEDTTLRNKFELADREMKVARSRYDRVHQAAFDDPEARHELAIAKTEYELKRAERDYAKALLDKTTIEAERSGFLIYSDKDKWLGRPVKTGERIMTIAHSSDVRARIDLPVADAIVLSDNAVVRLFLDADPLNSIPAKLVSESYHAEPNSSQQLVYELYAKLDKDVDVPRIGSRGTAQVYGDKVPLIFFLLRKPFSAARQYLGL